MLRTTFIPENTVHSSEMFGHQSAAHAALEGQRTDTDLTLKVSPLFLSISGTAAGQFPFRCSLLKTERLVWFCLLYGCPFTVCVFLFTGALQWSEFGFIAAYGVLETAALLPQLCDLCPQSRVLLLQKRRSDRDLVLLQSASVTWTFGGHVVLLPSVPVLIVLRGKKSRFEPSQRNTTPNLCILLSTPKSEPSCQQPSFFVHVNKTSSLLGSGGEGNDQPEDCETAESLWARSYLLWLKEFKTFFRMLFKHTLLTKSWWNVWKM